MTITLTPDALESIVRGVPSPRTPGWELTPIGREVTAYVEWARGKRRSEKTINGALTVLVPLCWYYPSQPLSSLSGKAGRRMLTEFLNAKFQKVTAATLGTYVAHLKTFFKWAYMEELVERDPTVGLERPRKKERHYVLFTPEQQHHLETKQPALRDRVAVMLVFDCALRAEDLRCLRIGDIEGGFVTLDDGKGGTARVLPIRREDTRLAVEHLMLEEECQPEEYLLHPIRKVKYGTYPDYDWKTIRRKTEPMSRTRLNAWWRRCLEHAGIEWHPYRHRLHDARHTTGTDLYRQKQDIRAVQKFMRHRSIASTELYMHLNEAEYLRETFGEASSNGANGGGTTRA